MINEQISVLLGLFHSGGAGEPESGPFVPLVLLQPSPSTKEEKLRSLISSRIGCPMSEKTNLEEIKNCKKRKIKKENGTLFNF